MPDPPPGDGPSRLRALLCLVAVVSGFLAQTVSWEHARQASEHVLRAERLSSLPSSKSDWNAALGHDEQPLPKPDTTTISTTTTATITTAARTPRKPPTTAPTQPPTTAPTRTTANTTDPNATVSNQGTPGQRTNNNKNKNKRNNNKNKNKDKNNKKNNKNNNAPDLAKLQDPAKPPSAAICTIVRDENRYLEEWALFHLALGFEKIYLYDNSDHGSAAEWLKGAVARSANGTLLERGVHVHPFPTKDNKRQLKAFRGCIEKFGIHHTWVALYDPDEFLVLKKHNHVVEFLEQHCPDGSLGINWVIFGTSNETVYDPAVPVTKRFRLHTGVDGHVKTIVRVADYKGQKSAHWVQLPDPKMRRDTNGKWIKGQRFAGVNNPTFHKDGPTDTAALHHYKYKSLEEFNAKGCSRGYVWNQERCFNQTLGELPAGHTYDDSAWRLLQRLLPGYYPSTTTHHATNHGATNTTVRP